MPVLRLDPERLVGEGGTVEAAVAWAGERVAAGSVLIASSASPEAVRALQARFAAALVAHRVRRLVVLGGETSGAVVDHLGLSPNPAGQVNHGLRRLPYRPG